MARWRLTGKHYLWVPGIEWEQRETNRETGRQARKVYKVPQYLDPEDPADQTPPGSGVIFVCHEGKGHPQDIIFTTAEGDPGIPTPEMEPLDAEAKAISDHHRPLWKDPMENLPEGNYAEALIARFEKMITRVPEANPTVSELMRRVEELTTQLAKLQSEPARRQVG